MTDRQNDIMNSNTHNLHFGSSLVKRNYTKKNQPSIMNKAEKVHSVAD